LEKKSSKGDVDSDKESNRDEDFGDGCIPKKGSVLGSLFAEQIRSLIANAIKPQLGKGNRKTNLYTKSYTKRIDLLRMPHGYQPPKFNQFNGKGNLKQEIAHAVETCSNAGIEGSRLVK